MEYDAKLISEIVSRVVASCNSGAPVNDGDVPVGVSNRHIHLSKAYLETFSSEFWTIVEGNLTWGKHPANLVDGDVFLDAGELAGKQVEGLTLNPLKDYKAGDTVTVGALSCFGYIFEGWKNNNTGELLVEVDGTWSFTYSGKATILVAQWKVDPNVQVNSGIK